MADSVSRRDWLRITAVAGVAVGLGGALSVEALRALGLRRVRQTRVRMGTVVTLTVVHQDGAEAESLVGRAFDEMERLEQVFSRYRVASAVGRLNRTGRIERPPPELVELLREANRLHVETDGAFDVTVAPLVDLYAGAHGSAQPSPEAIEAALACVGMGKLHVEDGSVRFEEDGMSITLDGVAKGYIVDCTRDLLVAAGMSRVLVNAGGDVRAHDASGTDPWTVGVQDPTDERRALRVVRLTSDSLATSSLPMHAFVHDRTQPQILDPRTGHPVDRVRSVTVRAESARMADALSTALMVSGPDGSPMSDPTRLGFEALFVMRDGTVHQTPGFEREGRRAAGDA